MKKILVLLTVTLLTACASSPSITTSITDPVVIAEQSPTPSESPLVEEAVPDLSPGEFKQAELRCAYISGVAREIYLVRVDPQYHYDYNMFLTEIRKIYKDDEGRDNIIAIGTMAYSLSSDLTSSEVTDIIYERCINPYIARLVEQNTPEPDPI